MASKLALTDPVTDLSGIGEKTAERLNRLNIHTVKELLDHIPRRYQNFSEPIYIKQLHPKTEACFTATLSEPKTVYTKTGKLLTECDATDQSGKIKIIWFNNPYIRKIIRPGATYTIAGKPSFFGPKLSIISPIIEEYELGSVHTTGLVPVYPQTEGVNSRFLRQKIHSALETTLITENLPLSLLNELHLPDRHTAYSHIHFPKTVKEKDKADKRLSFDEHLSICLANLSSGENHLNSYNLNIDQNIHDKSLKKLPFELTSDQTRAINNIYKDLASISFTHRLIMGDTGSGKTATILFAAHQAISAGFSCLLMAPTQILATQHYETFKKFSLFPDKVHLVTAGHDIPDTKQGIYIGTHTLISRFHKLKSQKILFVAIDEQHKFGVNQRKALTDITPAPHLFNLSATPIPRTVALGLLGDINVSTIRHKPLNRLPIKTFTVTPTYFSRSSEWLTKELTAGNKAFIVAPNISEHTEDVASVEKLYEKYKKIFKQFPIFALHGRMDRGEQNEIINKFTKADSALLVCTPLIEVGIDISSANIIIIHSADRFGLASLHQLRGRVGRGDQQAYCFLVPSTDDQAEIERLKLMERYSSGLTLARKDLKLRGAGEIFGDRQHGHLNTRLKFFWSKKLFQRAKLEAKRLLSQSQ